MKSFLTSLALGAAVLAGTPALAAPKAAQTPAAQAPAAPAAKEARIPFADHGGIRDFRVQDDNVVYVQATGGKWYRAELFAPCIGLRFHERLGFETSPGGSFDRWSAIRTHGQRCPLRSLTQAAPPAPAKKVRQG